MKKLALILIPCALLACKVDLPTKEDLGIPSKEEILGTKVESVPCVDGIVEVTNDPTEASFWRTDYVTYPGEAITAHYYTKEDMRDYVISWYVLTGSADVEVLTYDTVRLLPTSQGLILEAELTDIYTNKEVPTCGANSRAYIFVETRNN